MRYGDTKLMQDMFGLVFMDFHDTSNDVNREYSSIAVLALRGEEQRSNILLPRPVERQLPLWITDNNGQLPAIAIIAAFNRNLHILYFTENHGDIVFSPSFQSCRDQSLHFLLKRFRGSEHNFDVCILHHVGQSIRTQ